ncbi:cobalt transporter CbiM [Pararhizobium mangrovi]|uniref:Cobalt transporter CbiM n=1 Tax=Pararhizobium mangrovi TaxID=2590452 RepID=A0A506TX71_9HYPH|nr:cobalt transporter CbiM [Pararhizobium mangrovi]TPW26663.1 cobalt transporter CbiM [Pararhizobium mangrovi]
MHIPDGYLSPSTCAVTYAAAAPFWFVAMRRVRRRMQGRAVPMLAMTSAFSFVVMMFNLPIPGGTTAHAVGMGLAAILLGPWAGLLAISVALMIQALFFGDGGITAFGANAFNMAIVGCFVAHVTYRLAAGNAASTALRRTVAAGLSGYVAINAAALSAAVEFGIQPMLFTAADGTPLYAPYSLAVAVPAMMAAHLTVAGAAEAIVTGGVVGYLQRSHPELLVGREDGSRRSPRALWAGLGALMVASPLGLLATGIAWGEWGTHDFADAGVREQIAGASGGIAPPGDVPTGLARIADLWQAPIPDYAPSFLHSESLGYVLSAIVGVGLVILTCALVSWFAARRAPTGAA